MAFSPDGKTLASASKDPDAMKNYAGHRLSPWLGHLMVSRQETARPLLTPGEVMQLPSTDEIIMIAGLPPIRAKKIRYYEDRAFRDCSRPAPALPISGVHPDRPRSRPDAMRPPATPCPRKSWALPPGSGLYAARTRGPSRRWAY